MAKPPPNPIQRGEVITADWLNRAMLAGINGVRVGPGQQIHVNDKGLLTITTPTERTPLHTWMPAAFKIKTVEADYLVANPYDPTDQSIDTEDVYIAKPRPLRSGAEVWTTRPAYIANDSIIYAAPMGEQEINDPAGDPILLQDLNIDGRRADGMWAKIDSGSLDSDNKGTYTAVEQQRTATGWQDLPSGRTVDLINAREANNSSSGIQGNGVDLDGQVFTDNSGLDIQPIRGNPVVWARLDTADDGSAVWTFEASNAIDGECG